MDDVFKTFKEITKNDLSGWQVEEYLELKKTSKEDLSFSLDHVKEQQR
ncbi:hypothetical protein [Archaeoglobus profundus]|uniref:Uncharacterized protein n=1 Tax=Archaeoglobus profundus (strain DSM 5631 / JCM 9629 / NBRC 100127 / Av18) TaxID=572546 RepID=D2RG89_ARCPA|nr:hypothetical protein [Archaeoglobus profundus]ADB57314.1 hypothetical protein Arcpr_0244 [Archaeoglobus profundus DSM 5631]